jgi:hypothetical protein
MNSPLLGIATFAGEMASKMTEAVDAQIEKQRQGKGAVR